MIFKSFHSEKNTVKKTRIITVFLYCVKVKKFLL